MKRKSLKIRLPRQKIKNWRYRSRTRFIFEEINLICCYKADTKAATVAGMTAALPFMESELAELAGRAIASWISWHKRNLQSFPLSLRRITDK